MQFLSNAWDHMEGNVYGQQAAKSEIIEYLVSRLIKEKPRVLGLVGSSGVGKTSLAIHGISKAIGTPFYHISIGGLKDVTYFNGSFRCYKGSRQGIFADILIQEKCLNPIIYIDELDKIAADAAQEIYGILTHATDPLTNGHIHDYFLGIDLDLSKVTFIFSYNNADAIPVPLRDRIREIYFSEFNEADKVQIAKNFIIPKLLKEQGLSSRDIIFTDDIIRTVNRQLSSEVLAGGVRYLTQGYQSIIGKIMVNIISNKESYSQYCRITDAGDVAPAHRDKASRVKVDIPKFALHYKQVFLPYTVLPRDIKARK
jgi:ATP-dependent Lon protease